MGHTESTINSKIEVPFHMDIKIAQIEALSNEFYSLLLTFPLLRQPVITKCMRGRNISSHFQGIVQFTPCGKDSHLFEGGGVAVASQAPRKRQIFLDWTVNQSGGNALEIPRL
jgi:hypothetical protein